MEGSGMKKALLVLALCARYAAAQPDPDQLARQTAEEDRELQEHMDNADTALGQIMIVLVGGIAVVVVLVMAISADRKRTEVSTNYLPYMPGMAAPAADMADVSVLRIAVDGRTAPFVRSELARIDKLADPTTPGGRLAKLREVGVMLRRVRDAWVFGGAVNEPMRSVPESMAVFRKHADDARTRMTKDAAPEGEIDQSLILISIVVVARGELATVTEIGAGEQLRRALEAASYRAPDELLALDVIVAPADPDHTMSSLRLAALYPRPDLFPIQGALVGKTFCTFCGGPFPAELVTCPHCGAPAPGREMRAA
jgi:uncharacterized membrane protein